jgi:hypothetical protein
MTKRAYDRNGWFTVAANPISKVGVFPYRGASIGAPDPNKIYNVYRPAAELARQETIDSFKLLPFVDDHTMLGKATATSMPAERKGVHGVTGDNVVFDASTGTLNANLKVWSDSLQKTIDRGKQDISMGYLAQYRAEQGVFDGQSYDYVQHNILGNHAALVQDGRMGKDVAVLDDVSTVTFDTKDIEVMTINQAWIDAMKARVIVPANDKSIATLDAAVTAAIATAPITAEDVAALLKDMPAQPVPAMDNSEVSALQAKLTIAESKLAKRKAKIKSLFVALDKKNDDDEDEDEDEDDMEDVMDASGKPVMDAATGKPMRQKKATPATSEGATMNKAAMDAAIAEAVAKATKPLNDQLISLKAGATKVVLDEISKRDQLAVSLKGFVGVFDHAAMTLDEVAKYGIKKLEIPCQDGAEISSISAWLHGRKPASATHHVAALDKKEGAKSSVDSFIGG